LAAEHLVVAPGGSPGSFVDDELSRRGLQRHVAATVSSFLAAPAVVSESNLISTGPEGLWRRLAPLYGLQLSPVPLRVPRFEIDLVWHARRDADPAHLFLREALGRAALESWPRRTERGASRN
jgi:DNA-binding transcriptional LysR family regulator